MADLSRYIEERNLIIDSRQCLGLTRFKSLLFSDNILFFAPYEDKIDMGNLYMNLLYGLSSFITQYIKEDILFRGEITKGRLFYDENLHFVFGSGLVQRKLTFQGSFSKNCMPSSQLPIWMRIFLPI